MASPCAQMASSPPWTLSLVAPLRLSPAAWGRSSVWEPGSGGSISNGITGTRDQAHGGLVNDVPLSTPAADWWFLHSTWRAPPFIDNPSYNYSLPIPIVITLKVMTHTT